MSLRRAAKVSKHPLFVWGIFFFTFRREIHKHVIYDGLFGGVYRIQPRGAAWITHVQKRSIHSSSIAWTMKIVTLVAPSVLIPHLFQLLILTRPSICPSRYDAKPVYIYCTVRKSRVEDFKKWWEEEVLNFFSRRSTGYNVAVCWSRGLQTSFADKPTEQTMSAFSSM